MPDLPQRKVGIIACSGEELPEGTVTRLAALQVLEQLRPDHTVTICLPLFLAGGQGDRAFARFYPTIAVDGCEKRCAARATELYSAPPAASVVVRDLVSEHGLATPQGARRLDASGLQAVDVTANRITDLVDAFIEERRDRRSGSFVEGRSMTPSGEATQAACACGSGIPVQDVDVEGRTVALAALPLILGQFHEAGKAPGAEAARELLEVVRIYNDVPAGSDEGYLTALAREYAAFWAAAEAQS